MCIKRFQTEEICDRITLLEKENSLHKQIRTRILLLEMLQLIINSHMIIHNPSNNQTNINKELLFFIQQNYCSKISLHELAAYFHLSEKYISHYFKEQFQLTITQYITHLRLNKASHLLLTTTLPITEIALECGFANVSYFIRTFKKSYCQSPLKYRKKNSKTDVKT